MRQPVSRSPLAAAHAKDTVHRDIKPESYDAAGDEWQKIHYDNMTRVCQTILLGTADIASSPKALEWNAKNPKV